MPVDWGGRPSSKKLSKPPAGGGAALDAFVQPKKSDAIKRLNINIPGELHRRVKTRCASEGMEMTEVITRLLEQNFPKK
jgi:ParG protein